MEGGWMAGEMAKVPVSFSPTSWTPGADCDPATKHLADRLPGKPGPEEGAGRAEKGTEFTP